MLKTERPIAKNTGPVEAVKLPASNRTLEGLFRMVLIKSVLSGEKLQWMMLNVGKISKDALLSKMEQKK